MELAITESASTTENDESELVDECDELTESSENLFLRNLSEIIANSERRESLTIVEVSQPTPQPQFGYFVPIKLTPQLQRLKRCFH